MMYNKEKFFYGLHRKSSITNTIKEYSNIGFDEAAVKWFMYYFDAKLGSNTTTNKSNLVSPPYCWYESCTNGGGYSKTGTASANPVPNQPCWIQHCADEGGGGGGGGNGGGGSGGGGGFPPSPTPTPTPCPVNDGWYNIIPPPPCDVPDPNGCNVNPADVLANGKSVANHISTITKPEVIKNGEVTREKYYDWQFYEGKFLGYSWRYISKDKSVQVKVGNAWKFKSMEHLTHTKDGTSPFSASCEINSAVPSVSADKNYGYMKLDYTVKVEISCGISLYNTSKNDNITKKYLTYE
ncbi:MAG: hypothetical protein IPJ81_17365 [Chitinophagaceae bacterium]|nr:hypothetical protein [Chitinophagaceae bacterium]